MLYPVIGVFMGLNQNLSEEANGCGAFSTCISESKLQAEV